MRGDCLARWLIMLGFMDLGWPRVCRRPTSVLLYFRDEWIEIWFYVVWHIFVVLSSLLLNADITGYNMVLYINGLVQERRNSSALAMELHLSCTNPSIYCLAITRTNSATCPNSHNLITDKNLSTAIKTVHFKNTLVITCSHGLLEVWVELYDIWHVSVHFCEYRYDNKVIFVWCIDLVWKVSFEKLLYLVHEPI